MICTPQSQTLMEVHIFMPRKKGFNTKYSPEFKISVIIDMRENHFIKSELWAGKKYVKRVNG